jgi:hypothetical protein
MRDQKGVDLTIKMDQAHVMNIIRRLYKDESANLPNGSFVYPVRKKTVQPSPQAETSRVSMAQSESYVDYYQKVKHLATQKNWNEATFQKMLCDKKGFEREWNSYYRQKKKFLQGDHTQDEIGVRLHEKAMQRMEKFSRQKQIKDIEEIETAYQMAQIPKTKPLPQYYGKSDDLNASRLQKGEKRTLEQFIEDQRKFEQKKNNKLIEAIMKEESEETYVFAP